MMKIEDIWASIRRRGGGSQRRVDSGHPLDLYADFEMPDRPGLVLFIPNQPPLAPQLRAIETEIGRRDDGVWSLRLCLTEPQLVAVFAELCRDIIEFTRHDIDEMRAGGAVLSRLDRWQHLLQSHTSGLTRARLRGLIGELAVIERELLPVLGKDAAVAAWTGPLGTSQDFQLPDGLRIEVKTIGRTATEVLINGLSQLDAGGDPLQLAIVRLEDTGIDAIGAVTASSLVEKLRAELADAPVALASFDRLLGHVGWDDAQKTGTVIVRIVRIERHNVDQTFPRLTSANVPNGILDASYMLKLPVIGGSS